MGKHRVKRAMQLTAVEPALIAARFYQSVNKDGPIPTHMPHLGPCWVWTATRTSKGYGQFYMFGKLWRAHRAVWRIEHGSEPASMVLHACDGGPIGCVRTSHLFLGTAADNTRDMMSKGRQRSGVLRGEAYPNAVLSDDLVRQIRAARHAGEGYTAIARRLGLKFATVWDCVNRRWQHVKEAS